MQDTVSDRGEETWQRLIEAAVDVFGECGYEGTSTRLLPNDSMTWVGPRQP